VLQFTVDVTAADESARTIEGLAVPYGDVAVLNGTRYSFAPGSLALERARTPLLLGHDQSRPVGVLAATTDRDGGLGVRFAIDRTPDGDAALAQAASGSRGGLSIGAEVDTYDEVGGVRVVSAARILEISLVSLAAFAGAGVESVAAEHEPEPDDDDADGDDTEGDEPETDKENPMQETIEAGSAPVIIAAAAHRPQLSAGAMALAIAGAQRGEIEATNLVRAALTESAIADLTGVLPPSYQSEIIGGKSTPRPLFGVFGGRSLPSSGLAIVKPKWGVTPAGGWIAGNTGDAPSNAATIGTQQADIMGWAWGIAIPYMLAQRSDPDVLTAMYGEAVQDFYDDVETAIAAELAANGVEGVGTTIGALIGEFAAATDRTPDVVLAAPDVWGTLADNDSLTSAIAVGDSVSATGELSASFAGLRIVASAKLAAGTIIVATKRAIDARVTNPVKLTVNAIGALNVELGVVGEALVDTDYPGEILRANDGIALAAAASKRKASS
jgi:HK97 family phage prohead protease